MMNSFWSCQKRRVVLKASLTFLCLYVVSYYLMLLFGGRFGRNTGGGPLVMSPRYAIDHPIFDWFYEPMHRIDIRLRPAFWIEETDWDQLEGSPGISSEDFLKDLHDPP